MPAASPAQTASQAQYGGVEGHVESTPTPTQPTPPSEQQETLPTEETSPPEAQPTPTPAAGAPSEAAPTGRLPFTGSDLVLMLLAGAGLLGLGLVLRRVTGRDAAGA